MNIYEYNTEQKNKGIKISDALVNLAKKLILTESDLQKQQLLVKLLINIDAKYFNYKFQSAKTSDYETILKVINDFYNDKLQEKIKKIFIFKIGYTQKFVHIFQLIIDLAFNVNENEKERYVNQILYMNEEEKEVLMSYIQQITKRTFIQKLGEVEDDMMELKQQEYSELHDHFEELKRNYLELNQNHNNLKAINEKLNQDNAQLIQERDYFMAQLGVHASLSYIEVADKYKRDIKDLEVYIERVSKQLEDKNNQLKDKQDEMSKLSSSISYQNVQENEKYEILKKNKELQDLLLTSMKKQGQLREQVEEKDSKIERMTQEIEEKQLQINNLMRTKEKYQQVKSAHASFKRNFLERMGNLGDQTKNID